MCDLDKCVFTLTYASRHMVHPCTERCHFTDKEIVKPVKDNVVVDDNNKNDLKDILKFVK